jgi:hypothetical protein
LWILVPDIIILCRLIFAGGMVGSCDRNCDEAPLNARAFGGAFLFVRSVIIQTTGAQTRLPE